MSPTESGYNITIAHEDGGGLSSNIIFLADFNNGTTIHCVDVMAGFDMAYNCSLKVGEFDAASHYSMQNYCINANCS